MFTVCCLNVGELVFVDFYIKKESTKFLITSEAKQKAVSNVTFQAAPLRK
jgi:hypothetical protein